MKGGIVYSNYVNTVSPHHAWEARFTDQGYGLGQTLAIHHYKFGGILNGVDYDVWNPEIDRFIPSHYNVWNVEAKYGNKDALRDRLWLRKEFKPIIAYVGQLDAQKGVHLIQHTLFYALERGAQFVLLGSAGDRGINNHFWHLKHCLNENADVHMEIGFNEQLAHLIYAGADIVVVPSLYEPCGLAQMIAMRYGSVPVVRAVGGLVDTVFDRDHSDKPPDSATAMSSRTPTSAARVRAEPGDRPVVRLPEGVPAADHQRHGRRLLLGAVGEHYLAVYEATRCK